jgi:class 3 adenylate cyclase
MNDVMTSPSAGPELKPLDAIFVLVGVAGSSAACSTRGDLPTARVLAEYYTLVADAARPAEGRIIKVIGDGVLLTFPTARVRDAMAALRTLKRDGTRLWQRFDEGCRIQLKIGAGSVVAGQMGPPDDQRFDVYGDALNRLVKMPNDDVVISPEARALLS